MCEIPHFDHFFSFEEELKCMLMGLIAAAPFNGLVIFLACKMVGESEKGFWVALATSLATNFCHLFIFLFLIREVNIELWTFLCLFVTHFAILALLIRWIYKLRWARAAVVALIAGFVAMVLNVIGIGIGYFLLVDRIFN